ncbi:Ankyrin repeat domain-containing protein 54 [Chamberlinius hualienensis]
MAAAAPDSGGETGYESNDSSGTVNMESPKPEAECLNECRVPSPVPCFNFSSLSQDVLEPPAGLPFLNVVPLEDSSYAVIRREEYRCKMRGVRRMRHALRWKCIHGIVPVIRDFLGEKKLRIAANLNNVDLVRQLLEDGVNPRAFDRRKRSALHFASCKGYTEIVQLLLERGADPNQKDVVGNTPLHLAACTSHINVITLLLRHGANPSCLDNSGKSPLQLAQSKLRLLQIDRSCSSSELKSEAIQIIQMLQTYLQKAGMEAEAELLFAFHTRLTLSQNKDEADDNVRDLLHKLSDLNLKKS